MSSFPTFVLAMCPHYHVKKTSVSVLYRVLYVTGRRSPGLFGGTPVLTNHHSGRFSSLSKVKKKIAS